MSPRTGLAVISDVFDLSYTEVTERIGCTKQEVSMWALGKRNIPKKWLEKILELEELELFKTFSEDFLKKNLGQVEELEVQFIYYMYLIKKEGMVTACGSIPMLVL